MAMTPEQRAEVVRKSVRKYQRTARGQVVIAQSKLRYRLSEKGRATNVRGTLAYRRRHPERYAAREAVYRALRKGVLKRAEGCLRCCQGVKVQAHHHRGYAPEHWLDVVWLCRSCHLTMHQKEGKPWNLLLL
jgi:hypothetical protein